MTFEVLQTAITLAIGILYSYFYNKKNKGYESSRLKGNSQGTTFKIAYKIIIASTIIISLASFWSESKYLLRLHNSSGLELVGITLVLLSTIFFAISITNLGQQYSPCFDSYLPTELVETGVYKYIRHPIYTANIMLLLAAFVATGSLWILANTLSLTTYYAKSAKEEENELTKHIPRYCDYIKKTSMFFPG